MIKLNIAELDTEMSVSEESISWKCSYIQFMSKLYNESSLSKRIINSVLDDVANLFHLFMSDIKANFLNCVNNTILDEIFDKYRSILDMFGSEYKRFQFFQESTNFINPEIVFIGTRQDRTSKNNNVSLTLRLRTIICFYCQNIKNLLGNDWYI